MGQASQKKQSCTIFSVRTLRGLVKRNRQKARIRRRPLRAQLTIFGRVFSIEVITYRCAGRIIAWSWSAPQLARAFDTVSHKSGKGAWLTDIRHVLYNTKKNKQRVLRGVLSLFHFDLSHLSAMPTLPTDISLNSTRLTMH